jgi:DNA repair exonuclease SbcCD ATPase subunit
MRLEKIHIKGFGAIIDETFNFDPSSRVVILSGSNGQGKSTVFDAFRLATLDQYEGALRDYINWNCSRFEIDETFILRGKKIRSIVSCEGAGADRSVTIDGDPHQYKTASEAVKALNRLIDPKRFTSTSFAKQHELDIIETSPSERREYLKKLNDLTFVRPIRYIESKLVASQATTESLKTEQHTLLDRAYPFVDLKAAPMTDEEYLLRVDERDTAVRILAEILREQEKIPAIESLIARLRDSLSSKRSRLDSLKTTLATQNAQLVDLSDPEKKTIAEKKLRDAYNIAVAEIDKKIIDHDAQHDDIEAELVRAPSFSQASYDSTITELGGYRSELSGIDKKLAQIDKGVCPECGRPFDTDHKEAYVNQRAELQAKINECVARQAKLAIAKKAHDDANSSNILVERRLAAHDARRPIRDDLIKRLDDELGVDLANSLAFIDDSIASVIKLIGSTRANITDVELGIQDDESRLTIETDNLEKARSYDADGKLASRETDLIAQRDAASLLINEQDSVIAYNNAAENTNAQVAVEKTRDESRLVEIEDLIFDAQSQTAHLIAARDILKKELPSFIIGRIVSQLEIHMNAFLEQTYKGRYRVSIKEDRDALRIVYGPKGADVKRASGYERQVFSIAWKFAREQLDGVGILFLDEVDSEADDGNSQTFYKTILKLPYEQILAISHRPQTREMLRSQGNTQCFEIVDGAISA